MRNQVFKKLFSVLLALIMVAGLLPASVLAEGEGNADSTPAPTEAVQPTESAEPTAPTETETPEVTEVPAPTPENPAATVEPTQGEPTAEPTDEGIMPANVMPVQANVELQYRIVHLDCGRKYFSKDWIIALMYEAKAAGYNQVQLAFGNKGLRFLLDDMSVNTYEKQAVTDAIKEGNKAYYNAGEKNELTEAEMNEILAVAKKIGIEIVPLFNTPFHMEAVITAMGQLNIQDAYYGNNKACLNLSNDYATAFVKALMQKYITYFQGNGCKYFNFGADEYVGGWNNTFYSYANDVAKMISEAGMTARAFNDSFRYNSNTYISNEYLKDVCYWYTGYSGNLYSGAKTIADSGYNLINTNKDYYYVLDSSKSSEYKLSSGNYNNGNNSWENYAGGFSNTTYNNWNTAVGNGNYTATPAGSMFCIWCDEPGQGTETEVAQQIRMILRVIGARMQNKNDYSASDVHVEGGFKADGTINVPTTTVGNATTADSDTVRVTGPNLAALKCETATVTIQGAAEGKIAAYNVTPSTADSNYTEKAEVRIKIPAEWDSSKVIAFIVENDGTVKDITGKTEDGWYVFTAPHFSVMGIYEKAATTGVGGTITIVEGKEEVLTVDGKLAENEIGDPADTAVATKTSVKYDTKPGEGTQFTLGNKITTGEGVISDGNGNYLVVSDTGSISNTTEIANATVFTVTSSSGYWTTTYTIQVKDKSQYLTINNNNKLAIQNSSSSWYYYDGYGFYQQKSWDYYYLKFNNGWTASTGNGTSGYLYERKGNAILDDITKITFKGLKEGITTVTVAGVEYTIEVKAADLENVVLPINLWITNTGVVPTNWSNDAPAEFSYDDTAGNRRSIYTLKASHSTVNSPNGISLSSILPQVTGTAKSWDNDTYNVTYWKSAYHTAENRQSTDGWTNYSHKGTKFEYIRFYEGSWAYSVDGITWVNIENVGAGATDTDKNQVCIWYRQVTTVTSEVTTEIVDWGPIKYGANQCLLDFAVKYDGTSDRIPNSFPVTGKTIGFDCPTNQPVPLGNGYVVQDTDGTYYRTVYGIAGVETAEYEVYMITVTPTSDTHTDYVTKGTKPTELNYGGTEKIAWAKTEADANSTELNKMPNVKYGGEPFLESVKIYQYQGLLVTYYLRAKQTPDSLTVHYAIQGSETAFYEYNIAVDRGTTFDSGIALDHSQDPYVGGPLLNGRVTNSNGETITVSSNLATLQDLEPQYRYSKYKVEESKLKDTKNIWIYYTFTREHTYVIDFGLPLKIKFSDFGVTNDADIDTVSLWEKEIVLENKGLYGTAKVIMNDTEGKYVLYTLDKPLDKNITIPLYVKFSQKGDNDKPQLFTANIIPATNVYYEDSFAKFYGSDGIQQTQFTATGTGDTPGVWYIAGQEQTANQALEALGEKTNHNVYGYDPAYQDSTMFSMGSARKVTVTSDMAKDGVVWPTAQFTFKGTGFDIISLTNNTSGAIFVDVYKGNSNSGEKEKGHVVNNYYGYTYSKENGWEIDNNSNAIYQVPVIKVSGLTYGEHTVVIKVCYDKIFDVADGKKYSFWLDAVRVYNPAGNKLDTEYGKDSEAKPVYTEVRKALIGQKSFVSNDATNVTGAVFIDGKASGATIDEYKNYGPNHEVYLAQGQAIAFKIVADSQPKTVQLGVKLANGESGTLKIGGEEIKFEAYNNKVVANSLELTTATDMYYALTGLTWSDGTGEQSKKKVSNLIVLTNNSAEGSTNIISITNVKCTFDEPANTENNTVALAISYDDALMAVSMVNNLLAPEPEPEPEKTFEPERFEASWSRNVMQGRKATLTVKTSEDVEAITVDGQTIRSYRTRTERMGFGRRAKRITYREFTYSMVAQESADFSVTAINAEGTESEAITARLTVKTRPNSMRDMWDWFKGWF